MSDKAVKPAFSPAAEKVVHGFTLKSLMTGAISSCLRDGQVPGHAELWRSWFDGQECDHVSEKGGDKCKGCKSADSCNQAT